MKPNFIIFSGIAFVAAQFTLAAPKKTNVVIILTDYFYGGNTPIVRKNIQYQ